MQIMKLDYLKEKKELVSVVLLGVSVFLAVLLLVKITGFFVASAKAKSLVEKAAAQSKLDAKDMEKYFAESKALADELKRENLFAPPPPKQHPVREVPAILGDEVLINGKWYKAGEMVGDAKIVAIEPTQVKIEWEGREKIFVPIDAGGSSGPSGPGRAGPSGRAAARGTGPEEGRAEMVVVRSEARPMPGPGGMEGRFGGRERFQNMSEAERDRLRAEMRERREQFMNMSPEERERFMRERFGGGRGPGGGRRGGR